VFDVRATAPRPTSIRAGARPVASYRMRRALEPLRYRRAPSRTTATRRATLLLSGRADLQALSSTDIFHSDCNGVAAAWRECCPKPKLTLFEIAPQGDCETARKRHYADASHALAASRKTPFGRRTSDEIRAKLCPRRAECKLSHHCFSELAT
jgi:hypothetical protein